MISGPAKPAARLSFPADEQQHDWLAPLLEAQQAVNEGVDEMLRREQVQGRVLACRAGCAACCRAHRDIPVYPFELIGLTWYAVEKVEGETRARLRAQLAAHTAGEPCPFLVDEACSVHPLRPMACRQFNVFGRACAEGEDAYHSRRADVGEPSRRYLDRAYDHMLRFHGVANSAERRRMIEQGEIHRLVRVLQQYPWAKLAARMDEFDRRRELILAASGKGA